MENKTIYASQFRNAIIDLATGAVVVTRPTARRRAEKVINKFERLILNSSLDVPNYEKQIVQLQECILILKRGFIEINRTRIFIAHIESYHDIPDRQDAIKVSMKSGHAWIIPREKYLPILALIF